MSCASRGGSEGPCRWLSQGWWNSLARHWPCTWPGSATRGGGLQTLALLEHFSSQALDQAVTKDACLAVGFFQRGVAHLQVGR